MARAVRRYGRGLNSFLYRPGYGRPKLVNKDTVSEPNQPSFYVRAVGTGEYQVFETATGRLVASQLDTRAEAQAWIDSKVNA